MLAKIAPKSAYRWHGHKCIDTGLGMICPLFFCKVQDMARQNVLGALAAFMKGYAMTMVNKALIMLMVTVNASIYLHCLLIQCNSPYIGQINVLVCFLFSLI